MAKRTDATILLEFDKLVPGNSNELGGSSSAETVRNRLSLEILLDCRDYLQKIKKVLDDILVKP